MREPGASASPSASTGVDRAALRADAPSTRTGLPADTTGAGSGPTDGATTAAATGAGVARVVQDERHRLLGIHRLEVAPHLRDDAAQRRVASRMRARRGHVVARVEGAKDAALRLPATEVLVDDVGRDGGEPGIERAVAAKAI